MVITPLFFELSFSQSKIYFRVTVCCCTFVYHAFLSAITIERTICLNSTVTLKSLLCFFLNNLFVMPFDYLRHVLSTAIAYFNGFLLKILCNLLERGKCFSIKFKTIFATLVDTSKLNGQLNQMILRCRFLLTLIRWGIRQFCCMSTFFQCFLIFQFGVVKYTCIRRIS